MNHLPLPSSPAHPPITVPYLCTTPYDNLPFATYPDRNGYSTPSLLQARYTLSGKTWAETASFLQNWLWFGLLDTFLRVKGKEGEAVEWGDFLRWEEVGDMGGERRRIFTTEKLPRYLKTWRKGYKALGEKEREGYLERVTDMFSVASELATSLYFALWVRDPAGSPDVEGKMEEEDEKDSPDQPALPAHPPLPYEVVLSIRILGNTLSATLMEVNQSILRTGWGETSLHHDPLVSRMLSSGWCRNDIARFIEDCQDSGLYYASFIGREKGIYDHEGCSKEECVVNHIDEGKYRTRHVVEGCGCEFLGPDGGEVRRVLERGNVPLVGVTVTEGGEVRVEVFEDDGLVHYAAISHVWSDGLGNVESNTLPICQLKRLKELVDGLYKVLPDWESWIDSFSSSIDTWFGRPRLFFIDTLCVPLEKEYRRLAIAKMRESYKGSHRVLVLDSELQQIPAKDITREEAILRLACSSWMRRMWTLQEGRLARHLYAKFSDSFLNIEIVTLALMKKGMHKDHAYESIALEISHMLYPVHDWQDREGADYAHTQVTALRRRTTSKPADAPLCLASLLGLKTASFFDLEQGERMKAVLVAQEKLFGGILFHEGPRMHGDGNRWVPLTLGQKFNADTTLAVPHSLGLKVAYPGFVVEDPLPTQPSFTSESPFRLFSLEVTNRPKRPRYKVYYGAPRDEDDVVMFSPNAMPTVAIIVTGGGLSRKSRTFDGLQVIVYKQEGNVLFTKFDCSVGLMAEVSRDEKGSQWSDWIERFAGVTEDYMTLGTGWATEKDQVWVVG